MTGPASSLTSDFRERRDFLGGGGPGVVEDPEAMGTESRDLLRGIAPSEWCGWCGGTGARRERMGEEGLTVARAGE